MNRLSLKHVYVCRAHILLVKSSLISAKKIQNKKQISKSMYNQRCICFHIYIYFHIYLSALKQMSARVYMKV